MRRALLLMLSLLLLAAAATLAWVWRHRPGMPAYIARLAPVAPADADGPTVTWLGVTALLIRDGEHAIFIDPFFSRPPGLANLALNRRIAPDEQRIGDWLQRLHVSHLDAVLVSHSHFDHAMDAGVVARRTGARLLGSASTLNIGRGAGLPESALTLVAPGQNYDFGPFHVRFVESRHAGATGGRPTGEIEVPLVPPAHYLDYRLGGTWSIFVEHPRGTLLHHGSAGYLPGALSGRRADVAFLGVALIADTEAYLRQTVDAVGARRVYPVHWDDFTRPLDAGLRPFPLVVHLDRFFADMTRLRPGVAVGALPLAQPVAPFASLPSAD